MDGPDVSSLGGQGYEEQLTKTEVERKSSLKDEGVVDNLFYLVYHQHLGSFLLGGMLHSMLYLQYC